MLKKLLIASLATGALALNAPAALAHHVEFDCGFDTIAQEQVTGGQDTFTGVLYGFAVVTSNWDPNEWVGIRCYVTVDGTAVTPIDGDGIGPNPQFDTFTRQVTYTASDTQDVDVCSRVLTGPQGGLSYHDERCDETTTTQIPPQEVIDVLNSVFDVIADVTAGLDPIICGLLQAAGAPALVNTLAPTVSMDFDDCDLYVLGDRVIDFVPYDD